MLVIWSLPMRPMSPITGIRLKWWVYTVSDER